MFHWLLCKTQLDKAKERILYHLGGASEDQKGEVLSDWLQARSRLWAEIYGKLSYWQELPWLLCGLVSQNPCHIQRTASKADAKATHVLSRRFCDPAWNGIGEAGADPEVPLRPFMERLASGPALVSSSFTDSNDRTSLQCYCKATWPPHEKPLTRSDLAAYRPMKSSA